MPPKVMLPIQPKEQWAEVHEALSPLYGFGPRYGEELDAESADYKKWLEHKNSVTDITNELEKLPQKVKDTQAYKDLSAGLAVYKEANSGLPATVEDIDRSEKWPQFKENFPKLFGYGEGEKSLSEQLEAFNEATGYKYLSNNAIKTTSYICRRLEEARVKLEEAVVNGANAEVDNRVTRIRNTQAFETQLKETYDKYETACKAYDTANEGYELDEDEPAQDCRTDEGLRNRSAYVNEVLGNLETSIPTLEKSIADGMAAIEADEEKLAEAAASIKKQNDRIQGIEDAHTARVMLHARELRNLYEKVGGQGEYTEEALNAILTETNNRHKETIQGLEAQSKTLAAQINDLGKQYAAEEKRVAEEQGMKDVAPQQLEQEVAPEKLMLHLTNQITAANADIAALKQEIEVPGGIQEQIDKYEAEKQRLAQGLSRNEVLEFGRSIFSSATIENATDCYLSIEALRGWVKAPTQEGTYSAADIQKLATADGRKEVMNGQNEGLKTLADKLNKFVALYEEAYPKSYTTGNTNWLRGRTDSDVAARTMVEEYLKANPNGGDFGKELSDPKNATISAFSKRLGATLVKAAGAKAQEKIEDLERLVTGRKLGVDVKLNEYLQQRKELNEQIAKLEAQKSKYEADLQILKDAEKEAKNEPEKVEPEKDEPVSELQRLKEELQKAKVKQAKVLKDLKLAKNDQKKFLDSLKLPRNAKIYEEEAVEELKEAQKELQKLQDKENELKEGKESKENRVESDKKSLEDYKKLKEQLEKEYASLKNVAACKNEYDKKISGLQSAYDAYKSETKGLFRPIDDTRLENSLAGMQKLFDRHDKNQGSHGNSKEYDAVVAALAVASERINYGRNGDVKADVNKNLTALENAVDKYLEAKGSRTWGSNLRHTRMQFMDDIKAYCKTMREACGVDVKSLSEEQAKWDSKVLKESAPAMCVAVAKGMDITEMSIEVGEINAAAYNVELSGNVPVEEEGEIQLTGI